MESKILNAIKLAINEGFQISVDCYEYLKGIDEENIEKIILKSVEILSSKEKNKLIIDLETIKTSYRELFENSDKNRLLSGKSSKEILAKEYVSDINVIEDFNSKPICDVKGFVEYFKNRYKKLERIFHERFDVKDSIKINQALNLPDKTRFKVVGLVSRKVMKSSRLMVELEDEDSFIELIGLDREVIDKGKFVFEDQVICVDAVKYTNNLFVIKDFIWPDIPSKSLKKSETPLCVAFISDLHVGSKLFNKILFERFIQWINLKIGPPELRNIASRVKYVIINGDLVDGIGIYPDQINELEITDISEQYAEVYRLLSKLPDYIDIVITPGNHDATRKSLPQPPIIRDYAESLYNDDRFHMYGNPLSIKVHGVDILIYHGKSLDDILAKVPGLNYRTPEKGAELLLKCRHLAPIYGASTPLAPMDEDKLVISSIPDIMNLGHVHVYGYKKYRGVSIISSSTWQNQTMFQKKLGLFPTPGIVPILDLQNSEIKTIDFNNLNY
ncbi:MAG: DNA-directed DNA polymerase II small subunit [Candidatus Bathyarchaeia archaeon]